jgi:hypothetical protein
MIEQVISFKMDVVQPFYLVGITLKCLVAAPLWGIFFTTFLFHFLPIKVKSFGIWNFSFYLSLLIFVLSLIL